MFKRKQWYDYPIEETSYGHHKYGIGVYRFDPITYEAIEFWLDWESATPEEKQEYKEYLLQNGWSE